MFNKNNFKTRVGIVFTLFLVIFAVNLFPSTGYASGDPEFNTHANDKKTLRLGNSTQGIGWQDPISADPGDKVAFDVYYHNNVDGTVAENTKIRIDYPCQPDLEIVSTARLWADNASETSDTGTINIDGSSDQKLEFEDVAKWYPDQGTEATEIEVKSVGSCSVQVDIGDIKGCWPYQGHVVFTAYLVDEEPDPDPWGEIGCYSATESSIRLSYEFEEGSNVSIFRGSSRQTILGSGDDSGTYLDKGLSSDTSYTYYLRNGTSTSSKLLDRAYCRTDEKEVEEGLVVTKRVKSLERDTSYSSSLNASPGELIRYSIKVSVVDADAINVVVKDSFPERISFDGNLKLDGSSISGNIEDGIDIGDISEGEYKTVTFDAKIDSRDEFLIGTTSMTNIARATSKHDSEKDEATVHVKREDDPKSPTEAPTGITGNTLMDYVVLPFLLALIIFILFKKHFIALGRKLEEVRKEARASW